MQNRYYVYKHIRLDKNEPFYVGIGAKSLKDLNKNTYTRAYKKSGRSEFWNRIVSKSKYIIEIIFENNNKELVKQKEIQFIKLYGRRDLGLGSLVNLTDGGDGMLCCRIDKLCNPVYLLKEDLTINKSFICAKDCFDYINIGNYRALRLVCSNKKVNYKGFYICYCKDYNEILNYKNIKRNYIIQQLDKNNNIIRELNNPLDFEKYGFIANNITSCLRRSGRHNNFQFKKIYE